MEIWKDIEGYDYIISNYGNIKHIRNNKYLKERYTKGYNRIALHKNGKQKNFFVHRLVAEVFITNSEDKKQVNHIDGNKLNNNVDNLEWCTHSENQVHRYRILKKGIKSVSLIKNGIVYNFDSIVEASEELGIDASNISRVMSGERNTVNGYKKNIIE
jgi:hypothetical protein